MKILFMGDSITALGGWVRCFNEIIKPEHFVNIAVSSATLKDRKGTQYDANPQYGGISENNTVCNQVEKVLRSKDVSHPKYEHNRDYDDFDIIIVAAGTNDDMDFAEINSQFIDENRNTLPLGKVDTKTFAGAMRYIYENMRRLYPSAKICFCSPIQAVEVRRSYEATKMKGETIKAVCQRISDVHFINTFLCGICGIYEKYEQNGRDLCDGLHPNENGAKKIAEYNARKIKALY